jgi:hypothetical protein
MNNFSLRAERAEKKRTNISFIVECNYLEQAHYLKK